MAAAVELLGRNERGPRARERLVDEVARSGAGIINITFLPTWQGFPYLEVVIDAYSRRVVGWSMANHHRTELVLDALEELGISNALVTPLSDA